jgi:iron complex outermembrane receptor protein
MRFFAVLFVCFGLFGQVPQREVVVVTGSYEPIPLEEADRAVRLFDVKDNALVSGSIIDFLKLDPSLDVRQRAPGGVQADISIRGSSFGQTLVLVNGLRMNDVQSGHHNMDVPLPLESVSRVEVMRGAGSTLYGSDAVGGVVNMITEPPTFSEIRLRAAVGNFGVNQQSGSMTGIIGKLSEQLSFSRDFTSGFRDDRDYRSLALASTTNWRGSHLTLALSDRPFGADQFYGNYNSWERTKSWFASARQQLNEKTEASFAFRRHTDLFVLYRDRPQVFTNRHAVESYQGAVRRREDLSTNTRLFYGAEVVADTIDSNNLGSHSRVRSAGYVSFDARAFKRFSFTAGLRDEIYGSFNHEFSPSVSAGYWLSQRFKLRAGASRAFRLPTYTDLYYHDPANIGSPFLRPEKAWSYEGGLDWNSAGRVRGDLTVFHRRERDVIDYVRNNPADIWRATNFQSLQFTGVEASVTTKLSSNQTVDFRYTGLKGVHELPVGVQTKYVFNYPSHTGIISWQGTHRGFMARTRVGALRRVERDPYAIWDLYLARTAGRLNPFLQLTNISNTAYQEIPGVVMPGRAVIVGVQYILWSGRK